MVYDTCGDSTQAASCSCCCSAWLHPAYVESQDCLTTSVVPPSVDGELGLYSNDFLTVDDLDTGDGGTGRGTGFIERDNMRNDILIPKGEKGKNNRREMGEGMHSPYGEKKDQWGSNKDEYHRYMRGGVKHKAGVVGGKKYGKGGHYKTYIDKKGRNAKLKYAKDASKHITIKESDLIRLIKRTVNEQNNNQTSLVPTRRGPTGVSRIKESQLTTIIDKITKTYR